MGADAGPRCIFCHIVEERDGDIVYEDELTMAFMDINPATRGHLLIVPRAHRRDLWELTEAEAKAIMRTAWELGQRVRDALQPAGLNLVHATGKAGFQDVFHFHMHLIPRYDVNEIVRPWESTPGDPGEIAAAAAAIRGE